MRIGIVGAGICGAYLAYRLSKNHDVTVFESKKKIGNKACSGLVSERLWNFIPKNKKIVKNIEKKIIIHFKDKDVTLDLHPDMIVLERDRLDKYVAGLGNAKMMMNTKVKKLVYSETPTLITSKGSFEFDRVIGADGATSMIRKQLGGSEPRYNLGVFTYEKTRNKSDTVDTWPLKNGFAWKIPRGSTTEYGVFGTPRTAYQDFKKFYKKKPSMVYSALIPEGFVNVAKDKTTLCGDATGLTKPWSGGGIIWTLKSADMLVNTFPDFKKYNDKLRDFFEPRIFFSRLISKMGVSFGNNLPFLVPREILFDSDWIF